MTFLELFGVTETENTEQNEKKKKYHFQICGFLGPVLVAAGLIFPFVDTHFSQLAILEILEIQSFRDLVTTALFYVLLPVAIAAFLYLIDTPKGAWFFSAAAMVVFLIMTFSGHHYQFYTLGSGFWLMLSGLIIMLISPFVVIMLGNAGAD